MKPKIHLEICKLNDCSLKHADVIDIVRNEVRQKDSLYPGEIIRDFITSLAKDNVEFVQISEIESYCELDPIDVQNLSDLVRSEEVLMQFHVYKLDKTATGRTIDIALDNGEDEDVAAANQWMLPHLDFDALWESLIYDSNIKENLLSYIETMLMFSDHNVNANIVSWNRVVLLHGPPGTGKTSLCRALAHKLSIRYSNRYRTAQLVEINSHSLFSKYFSESGKLVMKMFAQIHELIEKNDRLVCVLIDEVESLAHARQSSLSGSEPSDAVRVVNAMLTQMDQIKCYPNVVVLTTSNITGAIDVAFVDRADIKQLIPLPSQFAIYRIYHSCIMELIRVKIIYESNLQSILTPAQVIASHSPSESYQSDCTAMLQNLCNDSVGLSGRMLRKIPFLACAAIVRSRPSDLATFFKTMLRTVIQHKNDKKLFSEIS